MSFISNFKSRMLILFAKYEFSIKSSAFDHHCSDVKNDMRVLKSIVLLVLSQDERMKLDDFEILKQVRSHNLLG